MSKTKTFRDLYNQTRGDVPLRTKQVHKDRREKRQGNRDYRERQDW